jgi:Spy/CpxP family protein refolding chaperone
MRIGKLAIVFGASLLFAGLATAQPPGGGFGGFGGGGGLAGMIALNKQLQDELKIDKDQLDKLNEALTKVREDLKDDLAKLRDFQTPMEDRTKIAKKLTDANAKAVETALKPEQIKRLHQIENQQAQVGMFMKEDVQKALKLTDDQKDKIDEINKELQKDLRDIGGGRGGFGGFNPEAQTKRQELQKEAMASIRKVLKDDQKTALKDLTGEPFELQFNFGGGFGGFGGGGRATPGKVLSTGAQDQLKLTAEQKKKLEDLQKEVDDTLAKILTDDQKKQLKDMQQGGGRGGPPGKPPQ